MGGKKLNGATVCPWVSKDVVSTEQENNILRVDHFLIMTFP